MIVEFLPYLSFNVFPGPEAYVLYGLILIVLVFFMPGGIVAGVPAAQGQGGARRASAARRARAVPDRGVPADDTAAVR